MAQRPIRSVWVHGVRLYRNRYTQACGICGQHVCSQPDCKSIIATTKSQRMIERKQITYRCGGLGEFTSRRCDVMVQLEGSFVLMAAAAVSHLAFVNLSICQLIDLPLHLCHAERRNRLPSLRLEFERLENWTRCDLEMKRHVDERTEEEWRPQG